MSDGLTPEQEELIDYMEARQKLFTQPLVRVARAALVEPAGE